MAQFTDQFYMQVSTFGKYVESDRRLVYFVTTPEINSSITEPGNHNKVAYVKVSSEK
jgi:hypothetical protein